MAIDDDDDDGDDDGRLAMAINDDDEGRLVMAIDDDDDDDDGRPAMAINDDDGRLAMALLAPLLPASPPSIGMLLSIGFGSASRRS
jgi:hypothetical protein